MKDHLSELHPSEMGFMCQIKKVTNIYDVDNPTKVQTRIDICLEDLIDEKSAEMKNIKVKFSEEAKLFKEKIKKEKNVVKKKTESNEKKKSTKEQETKKNDSNKSEKSKPFLIIGEPYSMAKKT